MDIINDIFSPCNKNTKVISIATGSGAVVGGLTYKLSKSIPLGIVGGLCGAITSVITYNKLDDSCIRVNKDLYNKIDFFMNNGHNNFYSWETNDLNYKNILIGKSKNNYLYTKEDIISFLAILKILIKENSPIVNSVITNDTASIIIASEDKNPAKRLVKYITIKKE